MEEMGMTDRQFKSFIRLFIKDLKEVKREENKEKQQQKLDETIENLQQILED